MNSHKYNFSDFTRKHYEEILTAANETYTFIGYENALTAGIGSVLWRHDVDMNMADALAMARIEYKLGIKANYFILLHSEFYNLLENSIREQVNEILALGHTIGLHFDYCYYNEEGQEKLEENLLMEARLLSHTFKTKINAFAFHNPTQEALVFKRHTYAGLINTYSNEIREKFHYCSDSNGYWRHERMYDLVSITKPRYLHALTHPVWWTEEIRSPKDKIRNCVESRANTSLTNYTTLLNEAGRQIIDWGNEG